MSPRIAAVLLLAFAGGAAGGPRPPPKGWTRTEAGFPQAVDFSPLAAADPDGGFWEMRLVVRSVSGKSFTLYFNGLGRPGAASKWVSWVPEFVPAGWDFAADAKGPAVTFKGYKGSPVCSVEVSVKGLGEKYKPTVTKPGKK